jgi:hypothetical protein
MMTALATFKISKKIPLATNIEEARVRAGRLATYLEEVGWAVELTSVVQFMEAEQVDGEVRA